MTGKIYRALTTYLPGIVVALDTNYLIHSTRTYDLWNSVTPVLQIGKLRFTEVKSHNYAVVELIFENPGSLVLYH